MFTLANRTFFITSVCHERRPILRADDHARLLIRTMYQYRVDRKFLLNEFVVMHEHIHLIITPNDLLSAEKAVQLIKGRFSFEMGKQYPKREIWQPSFTLHRIENEADYRKHRNYIHQNPIEAGYAKAAADSLIQARIRASNLTLCRSRSRRLTPPMGR